MFHIDQEGDGYCNCCFDEANEPLDIKEITVQVINIMIPYYLTIASTML
jgi:hypothetical protein